MQASSVASEHGIPIMSHAAQLGSLQVGCATPGFAAAEYMSIQLEMDLMWFEDMPLPENGRWAPFADRPG